MVSGASSVSNAVANGAVHAKNTVVTVANYIKNAVSNAATHVVGSEYVPNNGPALGIPLGQTTANNMHEPAKGGKILVVSLC